MNQGERGTRKVKVQRACTEAATKKLVTNAQTAIIRVP
jgi:hypothetical protein